MATEEEVAALRAELAVRERFWNLSLDLMDVASFETGRIVRANPAWTRVLGWDEAELKAAPLFDFIHPDDRAAMAEVLGRLSRGIHLFDFSCRMVAKDGTYRVFEWVAQAEGDFAYGYGRDVTEKRRSERLLARATEMVPMGLAFIDAGYVFQWANPAMLRMLGLRSEDVIGRTAAALFPRAWPALAPVLDGLWAEGRPEGRPYVRRGMALETGDGRRVYDVTHKPVFDAAGRPEGVLTLMQDVTEEAERAEAQQARIASLTELDEAKDQFLGVLSHELRTPINAITGFGSVLEDEIAGPLNDTQRLYAAKILGAADTMLALITDLLDLTSVKAGTFTVERRPMKLATAVSEAIDQVAGYAASKAIRLEDALDGALPAILADARRIRQVVSNLLGNAVKFTPAGGCVEVRARVAGDRMRVEVADDGPGIRADVQGRLFEPFTQADMSATRAQGGLGLGLAVCKSIVDAHGGRIGLDSTPGAGTTVWFELPLAPQRR